ncbi:MAG: hypothetical protein M1433_00965 [Candidatus Parvarchaeota archaeon]|nr:hypothetical protein [Candidatus Parvarchaeota archaeon]
MSKQDDLVSAELILKGDKNFIKSLSVALSSPFRGSDKIHTELKGDGDNLYIEIKAKNINLLQSVIKNYLSAASVMEDINKL